MSGLRTGSSALKELWARLNRRVIGVYFPRPDPTLAYPGPGPDWVVGKGEQGWAKGGGERHNAHLFTPLGRESIQYDSSTHSSQDTGPYQKTGSG